MVTTTGTTIRGFCYRRGNNEADRPDTWRIESPLPLEVEFNRDTGSVIGTARITRDELHNLTCVAELDPLHAFPPLLAEHPYFAIGVRFEGMQGIVFRASIVGENVDPQLPQYRID